MGWIRKIFGLEKEEPAPEPLIPGKQYHEDICGICNLPIGIIRYKKIDGKKIHKKCFKLGMKLASRGETINGG
jgi:hypothetical protein